MEKNENRHANDFKKLSIIISFAVIILLAIYYYPFFNQIEFTTNFAASTFATFVGAVSGLSIVFWINEQERNRSISDDKAKLRDSQIKIITVLTEDIIHNKKELEKYPSPTNENAYILRANLKIEAWKTFSAGGELQSIKDPEIIHKLANIFDMIASIIYLLDLLTDLGLGRANNKGISTLDIKNQTHDLITKLCVDIDEFLMQN